MRARSRCGGFRGLCYTEKAPNAWQRRGTQKAGNTYNQPNRPNRHTSQTKHQALPKGQPGRRITPINTAAVHASAQQQPTISTHVHTRQGHHQIFSANAALPGCVCAHACCMGTSAEAARVPSVAVSCGRGREGHPRHWTGMAGSVHAIRRCGRPWPSGGDARKRKGCISCLGCSSPDALTAAHHDRDARSPFRTAPTANHACVPCRRAALWRTQHPWQRRALCWRAAALQIQGGQPSAAAPPQRQQRTAAPPPCLPPPPPALRCVSRLHALQIHPATGHRRHARATFVSSCTAASPAAPPPPRMRGRGGVTSRS